MITALRSVSLVNGGTLWLLFWVICAAIYLIFCLIRKHTLKKGIVFLGLAIAEIVIDLFWTFLYYPQGTYIEYGLSAIFGLLAWIPVLVITAWIVIACRS